MERVRIRRQYNGMPQGAQVGQEIDLDDDEIEALVRDGSVERSAAASDTTKPSRTGVDAMRQPQDDRPVANQGKTGLDAGQNRTTDRTTSGSKR